MRRIAVFVMLMVLSVVACSDLRGARVVYTLRPNIDLASQQLKVIPGGFGIYEVTRDDPFDDSSYVYTPAGGGAYFVVGFDDLPADVSVPTLTLLIRERLVSATVGSVGLAHALSLGGEYIFSANEVLYVGAEYVNRRYDIPGPWSKSQIDSMQYSMETEPFLEGRLFDYRISELALYATVAPVIIELENAQCLLNPVNLPVPLVDRICLNASFDRVRDIAASVPTCE